MTKICLVSALKKIFPDEEISGSLLLKSVFLNEPFAFQTVVRTDNTDISSAFVFEIEGVSEENYSACKVEYVPSLLAAYEDSDDYFLKKESGLYPDLLLPIKSGETFVVAPGKNTVLWFEVSGLKAGDHKLKIRVRETSGEHAEAEFCLHVIGENLPESDLIVTNWLYCDCICDQHLVEPFGKEFYAVLKNYLKNYVSHGNNMLLTPLFTPPLNVRQGANRRKIQLVRVKRKDKNYLFDFSDLGKFMRFALRCGIKYFEMSHLFSQWGAEFAPQIFVETEQGICDLFGWKARSEGEEYRNFLGEFLPALTEYLKEERLLGQCFFHLSDEPSEKNFERYGRLCKFVKPALGGRPVMDALSDFSFYGEGFVDQPVVAVSKFEKFAEENAEYWIYYCWEHAKEYVSNRFFAMPSLRTRILGAQLYKNRVRGFLQWGYNYYYTAFSERKTDPFVITDCERKFPSGDAFIVYPDREGGSVFDSVRNQAFRDGINDYRALKLAEEVLGRTRTEELLREISVEGFKKYKREDEVYLKFREKLNSEIEKKLK